MAYLVLARKYRPTTFSEVVGQDHVTRTLANAFASGRVHHAFLFCGPRGVGKTTMARILGKALNCERGASATPCGTCSACTSIAAGNAVDYVEMDGASNRGIDAIRDLTESVRYQPAMLRKKVYVIDEVHMLTTEAFNALLKTLEEPPPHVTFVLATTEAHKLPNTILSRCQRYDVKLVAASRLGAHLQSIFTAEKLQIEPGAISLIVRESGGSVRDALSLCDQLISYVGDAAITERHVAEVLGVADRALTRTLIDGVARGDAAAALAGVDAAIERGVDEVQVARAVVRALRDLAVLQAAPGRPELVDATADELADLTAQAQTLAPARLQQMFARMLRCCDDLGRTLQPRLVLDFALIEVATLEPLVPLGDLIDRLGDLETRLARGGATTGARAAPPPPARRDAPAATATAPAPSIPQAVTAAPAPPTPPPAVAVSVSVPAPVSASGPAPVSAPNSASVSAPDSASVSAPASVSVSAPVSAPAPTDLAGRWEAVVTALEDRRKFSLLGLYQHARVMAWTDAGIELGFAADFHTLGEMAREKASLDEMRAFLREHTGHVLAVAVRLLDETESAAAPARSMLEVDRERAATERSTREAEARAHPMVRAVLQEFGATIREIKTDV